MQARDATRRSVAPAVWPFQDTHRRPILREGHRWALFHSENRLCAPGRDHSSGQARPQSVSRRYLRSRSHVVEDRQQLEAILLDDTRALLRKLARWENRFFPSGIA